MLFYYGKVERVFFFLTHATSLAWKYAFYEESEDILGG